MCYKKHPYHSYVFLGCLLLSSILTSTNLLPLRDKRELKSHVCLRQSQDQNPFSLFKVCECVCGITVFAGEDRNILGSFLIGCLWLRTCGESYLLVDLCGLSLMLCAGG